MEKLTLETFKTKIFDFEKNQNWTFLGKKPTIIDFYADWCGPCKMLDPILKKVASDFSEKIDVYKVDTEDQEELAAMFGIRSIPSILFIPLESEPVMANGFISEEGFKEAIADLF